MILRLQIFRRDNCGYLPQTDLSQLDVINSSKIRIYDLFGQVLRILWKSVGILLVFTAWDLGIWKSETFEKKRNRKSSVRHQEGGWHWLSVLIFKMKQQFLRKIGWKNINCMRSTSVCSNDQQLFWCFIKVTTCVTICVDVVALRVRLHQGSASWLQWLLRHISQLKECGHSKMCCNPILERLYLFPLI